MPKVAVRTPIFGYDVSVTATGTSGPILAEFQRIRGTVSHVAERYTVLGDRSDRLYPGHWSFSGTLSGALTNMNAISQFTGQTKIGVGVAIDAKKFTVTYSIDAPGKEENGKRATFGGCVLSSLNFDAAQQGQANSEVAFDAETYEGPA